MGDTIWDWSITAADNATADSSIDWSEGQMPSTVNNSAREMMAKIAHFRNDLSGTLVTGGTGNAYTVSPGKPPTDLTGGWAGVILFDRANSGSATLQVGSLTAYPLVDAAGNDLAPGEITANSVYLVNFSTTTSKFHLTAAVHSSGVHTVSTISDLVALGGVDRTVYVLGYHSENDGGGGLFYWDAAEDKANHNGGTIIDPDVTFPTDWTDDVQRAAWFTAGTGTGCWIRASLNLVYNPKHFGAKGDGAQDDYDSISAAISAANTAGVNVLYIPSGSYVHSATITPPEQMFIFGDGGVSKHTTESGTDGTGIVGVGERPDTGTLLVADFTGGPGVRIKYNGVCVKRLMVDATDSRRTTGGIMDVGIHAEPPDTAGASAKRFIIEEVRVANQPGHGIVAVDDVVESCIRNCDVDHVLGHGIYISGGSLTSRTNKTRPGQIIVDNCRSTRTGGHSICIGGSTETSSDDVPYRIFVNMLEGFYNCIDPTICEEYVSASTDVSNAYVSGENIVMISCATDGRTENPSVSDTHSTLTLRGHNVSVQNYRFIDGNPYAAKVDAHTILSGGVSRGIHIDDPTILNDFRGAGFYDPAIYVASGVRDIRVSCPDDLSLITNLTSRTSGTEYTERYAGELREEITRHATTIRTQRSFDGFSIANDATKYFEFTSGTAHGMCVISTSNSSGGSAFVHFRAGTYKFATIVASSGGPWTAALGALTGTTGTAGDITVSVTDDYKLYIENRAGASKSFTLTFLSIDGDEPVEVAGPY